MNADEARAAWLPWSPDTGWDDDEADAVDWVSAECSRLDAAGLLLVEAHAHDLSDELATFARRHEVATRRTNRSVRGSGPVLAHTPGLDLFEDALRHSRGSSLCVIEGYACKVGGWARAVRATDLRTGEVAEPLSAEAEETLGHLMLYANNAFADVLGKKRTPTLLDRLLEQGVRRDEVPTLVMARGASARGAKHVVKAFGLNMS